MKLAELKGVTLLRATEAAKQLVICIKRRKINALILIAYRYPYNCGGRIA